MNKKGSANNLAVVSFVAAHVLMIAYLYFLTAVVLGRLMAFERWGVELPMLTRVVIETSHLVRAWFLLVLLGYLNVFVFSLVLLLVNKNKEFQVKLFGGVACAFLFFLFLSSLAMELPKIRMKNFARKHNISAQEIDRKTNEYEPGSSMNL